MSLFFFTNDHIAELLLTIGMSRDGAACSSVVVWDCTEKLLAYGPNASIACGACILSICVNLTGNFTDCCRNQSPKQTKHTFTHPLQSILLFFICVTPLTA